MNYKVHVGYGFHINCYHSYRGDTNDNLGFGSDIRIIRKILDVLTEFNERGIPVKGTWDSENFFSLQEILPKFAPDIIEKMKIRTEKYGDEQIIMGYSNGALGAMTEEELEASIELAITNSEKSGLKDIFSSYEKIVRPQEVMFTPSQVSVYNRLGVKALCLYYSCVPFDAFRTIIPKLPDEMAFNPLTYTYKGESLTIIPTYSNSDVCDAGCLRAWVKDLHSKQEKGEINNDVFIFINMDADAIFWESMNLPVIGNKLANTDGIHGLVEEIADLPYVVFDTPGGYLRTHKPLGNIDFTHDTADGNFTGYASWAEKPYNRKIWTAIERSRALSKINAESDFDAPSFKERVLLLSTTHFGLATPVLNIQRERKADALAKSIINSEVSALPDGEKLTIYATSESYVQSVQLKVNTELISVSQLKFEGADLEEYAVVPTDKDNSSVFVFFKFKDIKKKYVIDVSVGEKEEKGICLNFKSDNLNIRFDTDGNIDKVKSFDRIIGEKDFLRSFITYGKERYSFSKTFVKRLDCGGKCSGISVDGEMHLPGEITAGEYRYDFFKVDFCDGIYVKTYVKYPYTPELTSISTENSALGRYSDMDWKETAPFEITPHFTGDVSVVKRNFMGDVSSFRTQSFPESDERNKKIDSFNHQLTGGFVGLTDGECGFVIANPRQVLSSMAHCPMRLDEDKTVHMNPFGTYYGKQRHHFSRAKDQILDAYTYVAAQSKSLAPSYNGNSETAISGFFAFQGKEPTGKKLTAICTFADGCVAVTDESCIVSPFFDDNVVFADTKQDAIDESKLKNPVLTGLYKNLGVYLSKGIRAISHIIITQIKSK